MQIEGLLIIEIDQWTIVVWLQIRKSLLSYLGIHLYENFAIAILCALVIGLFVACSQTDPDLIFEGNGTIEFQFEIDKRNGTVNRIATGNLRFDSGFIVRREVVFDGDRQ